MPLDRTKARGRVEGARNAYRVGIRADFIQLLADDLDEALKLLDMAALDTSNAKHEAARVGRELDDEKTAYRKLREQSVHTEKCVLLLRSIAKSPKGAAVKAAEMLKEMGVTEEAVVTAALPVKIEVP